MRRMDKSDYVALATYLGLSRQAQWLRYSSGLTELGTQATCMELHIVDLCRNIHLGYLQP